MKVITFDIGRQPCVMPVHHLVEILPYRPLLPMPVTAGGPSPNAGVMMVGILDYRGRAVPVMGLRLAPESGTRVAGEPGDGPATPKCLLVLGHATGPLTVGAATSALAVGRVNAVVEIDEQSIQSADAIGLGEQPAVSGVCRLGQTLAFVIDGAALTPQSSPLAA
jgi:chemotaxis signal transduction protein